jgi:serine/threonine protein kinase
MGDVYKAEDIKLERTVALKFLPAELTVYPEAKERFIREAKAAAALSHPHIRIRDWFFCCVGRKISRARI